MKSKYNIVIIGGGQLGSRHLQACCLFLHNADVFVIDPNKESLDVCEERAGQMPSNSLIKIHYHQDLNTLPSHVDVAIVATNSNVRAMVVKELISKCRISNLLLEKFLFPEIEQYETIRLALKENSIKAWVNCPRRMFEIYQEIKELLDTSFTMKVEGKNWGLGSNGIHFIDLFSLFNRDKKVNIDVTGLDDILYESKRSGYKEVLGEIKVDSGENSCSIICTDDELVLPSITIETSLFTISINESQKEIKIHNKESEKTEIRSFEIPYQSGLTQIAIQDILEKNECDLTPYLISSHLHQEMLKGLLNKYTNGAKNSFEIT